MRLMNDVGQTLPARLSAAGLDATSPIITDRPIWLSDAIGRPTLALPDEPVETMTRLAADFGARVIVVFSERGPYPAALSAPTASSCVSPLEAATTDAGPAVFVIREACLQ